MTAVMPPEWFAHDRTFLAWPTANATFASDSELARARHAWGQVARTVASYEPVTILVDPADRESVPDLGAEIRSLPLDDAWVRDSGPTFVHGPDGSVRAVDWTFNGWGGQDWARTDDDQHLARRIAAEFGVPARSIELVNEGGALHVDGRGTVLLTDTVQLDPGRNPGLDRVAVEQLIHDALGTTRAIWLPRGLSADYGQFGTRGHVDIVAAFVPSGAVLVHRQTDPSHPDHAVTAGIAAQLAAEHGADGRALEVIDLPAPRRLTQDGELLDWSYVNHYVANGVVVLCAFDDPRDDEAAAILGDVYPDRRIELVDARDIFAFGGGIHCITQQLPRARA
jgi:agmatine deiminase